MMNKHIIKQTESGDIVDIWYFQGFLASEVIAEATDAAHGYGAYRDLIRDDDSSFDEKLTKAFDRLTVRQLSTGLRRVANKLCDDIAEVER
jgi:hypothetical protein